MMEEDSELLDWGNEDDVVSLGDEEESYTLENLALPPQNSAPGTPPIVNEVRTPSRSHSPLPLNNDSSGGAADQKSRQLASTETKTAANTTPQSGHKLTILPRLTHALPPKPVTASVPYVPPSDPSIVEATAMALRSKKSDATTVATTTTSPTPTLKNGSRHDHIGPLPVPWEVCIPRSGNGIYYHNSQTGQTQWDRPSSVPVVSPPATLSHDDRHYRPSDDRYSSHGRLYSNPPARSPRGRNRSRSVSPPSTVGRDSRARGNTQRPARGRPNTKTNVPQREPDVRDLPKADDRHWVPSPPPSNKARGGRRQRRQNHSMDDRMADSGPEEADQLPPQRDIDARGHNHDRERTYTPSDNSSSRISAPRPATPPPPRDDRPVTYEVKVEIPRESLQERHRSPPPPNDQRSSESLRRERPSRFGPGQGPGPGHGPSSTVLERGNGLPMKPVVSHNDRPGEARRTNSDRPYDRRVEQDRRYEDSNTQNIYPAYAAPANRSPILMRDQAGGPDRSWVPNANDDRDKTSSVPENVSSARKRPPLPPQEAEFREIGRPRPATYPEPINQRSEDVPRRPGATFHDRGQADREINLPPSRPYPPREDARDTGYSQVPLPSRNLAPVEYDRDRDYDRDREHNRLRARQRFDEREDVQRSYDRPIDSLPASDIRGGYIEREREPPSKPRAMNVHVPAPSNVYTGPSNQAPAPTSAPVSAPTRYHDRPSPPHLSVSDTRRDIDARPVPPASTWPERREAKVYQPPSDRPTVREPRGRTAPTSSANSIPIGNKRIFTPVEPPVNDYHPPVPNDHYGRPSYPTQEPPRSAKADYSRIYSEIEPVQDTRQKYPRIARDDSFLQAAPDDRAYGRRGEKPDPISRNPAPPPIIQPENPSRSRSTRFSSDNRNSRLDHELMPDLPTSKNWSGDNYDTSPRGRYRDDPTRDATPPPLSRETSYTSPQWDPPSSSSSFQDPHVYHELPPPPISRMDIDPPPSRQALGASVPYNVPAGERYRREEVDLREPARAPLPAPPRSGNRRDQSVYSPELQRAPVVVLDNAERGNGSVKRNPSNASVDQNLRNERPWMAAERHPLPLPPFPEARRQIQENRTDKAYNGEPLDAVDTRQVDYVPLPAKTFEQRLSLSAERPPMPPRGASLLSRISRGGNDIPPPPPPPPPPSLRDRVQIGIKRDRDDVFRDHLPERPLEVDDGETDFAGTKRGKKRRRNRRGGPP